MILCVILHKDIVPKLVDIVPKLGYCPETSARPYDIPPKVSLIFPLNFIL